MMLLASLSAIVVTLLPAEAIADPTTAQFLLSRAPAGSTLSEELEWTPAGDALQVIDPVVFPDSLNSNWIEIPQTSAQVQMLMSGPPYHEPTAAFVTFSDRTPVCAMSGGLIGVDGGMGAFTTLKVQEGIKSFVATLPEGWSLYDGLLSDQSEDGRRALTLFKLPDGTEFPGFFTGGDGGFSVSVLHDTKGAVISAAITFNQASGSSLLPAACAT